MYLLGRFLDRIEFDSYSDFKNNFSINTPEDFDFARDIVDVRAANEPDKRAFIYVNDDGEERNFTFSDVSELSKRAATYFSDVIGIKPGDRVLTLLRRRWEYWIIAVALHRIGAVVVPASIQLTEKDIVYRINSADVKVLIAINDPFVLKQISETEKKCPSLRQIILAGNKPEADIGISCRYFDDEFIGCEKYEKPSTLHNSDEMVIYFTSGTSGMPKMAIHNRLYPLGHIVTAKYMQRVVNGGLHITQADSGWAKFGWGNIYGQWICGAGILAYDPIRFDSGKFLSVLQKYKPNSLCVPPTMYRLLMRDGLRYEHVKSIGWFSTAGEPLSGEVNKEFYSITGKYIHEGFGQSEGTPITCGFEWFDIRPASMGKPSPLYDTHIIHSDGSECRPGETGEVVIYAQKGKIGLLDYYYSEGQRIEPIVDGVYHTGDTAFSDEDGYYWYVGRADDMIKSSGYRIGPFEIESVLNTHPAVIESAIIGCPDPIRGQIVCAVIVLKNGYEPSDELTKELQNYVKTNTAPYKYPRKVIYLSELPKTTSGKIIRTDVRKIALSMLDK